MGDGVEDFVRNYCVCFDQSAYHVYSWLRAVNRIVTQGRIRCSSVRIGGNAKSLADGRGDRETRPIQFQSVPRRRYAMERQLLGWIVTRPPIGPTKLTRMPSLTRAPRKRVFTLVRSLSVAWQEARAVVITISFVIYNPPPVSTVPGLLIKAATALSPLREREWRSSRDCDNEPRNLGLTRTFYLRLRRSTVSRNDGCFARAFDSEL